ncbi:MAG: FMN-binding negative transcriptional regulator [Chitinophagaceae bacterium]
MYVPRLYRNENIDEIITHIHNANFGIIISVENNQAVATHIPFVVFKKGNYLHLQFHVSKANPQTKNWSLANDVLVIFQGAHSYISASWYDHENVSTWNYIAIHVYGNIRPLDELETLAHLQDLVHQHEKHETNPIDFNQYNKSYIEQESKGLLAYEIQAKSIYSAFKLSQNRDTKNYAIIIEELVKRGDENSLAIAQAMRMRTLT